MSEGTYEVLLSQVWVLLLVCVCERSLPRACCVLRCVLCCREMYVVWRTHQWAWVD